MEPSKDTSQSREEVDDDEFWAEGVNAEDMCAALWSAPVTALHRQPRRGIGEAATTAPDECSGSQAEGKARAVASGDMSARTRSSISAASTGCNGNVGAIARGHAPKELILCMEEVLEKRALLSSDTQAVLACARWQQDRALDLQQQLYELETEAAEAQRMMQAATDARDIQLNAVRRHTETVRRREDKEAVLRKKLAAASAANADAASRLSELRRQSDAAAREHTEHLQRLSLAASRAEADAAKHNMAGQLADEELQRRKDAFAERLAEEEAQLREKLERKHQASLQHLYEDIARAKDALRAVQRSTQSATQGSAAGEQHCWSLSQVSSSAERFYQTFACPTRVPCDPSDPHLRLDISVEYPHAKVLPDRHLGALLQALSQQLAYVPCLTSAAAPALDGARVSSVARAQLTPLQPEPVTQQPPRWPALAKRDAQLRRIQELLLGHAAELAHMHAFYAVASVSGERQLAREKGKEGRREDTKIRLSRNQFSRLLRDAGVLKANDNLSHIDAIFHAALGAASRLQHAQDDDANTPGGSGAQRVAEAQAHFESALHDSAVGMGVVSFLASLLLVAAATYPPVAPTPPLSHGTEPPEGRRDKAKLPTCLSGAVSALLVNYLMPRTCTLEYLWR